MQLPRDIVALLDQGGVLVTANARAARAVRLRYADEQEARGRTVWPAPHAVDFETWAPDLWQSLLLTGKEDRLLLNSTQERALWSEIVTPAVREGSLLSPEGIASLSQEAYALLCSYRALPHLNASGWGEAGSETALFRRWARTFAARCKENGWLAPGLLPEALAHALASETITPPARIGWLGFDRATPAQQLLMAAAANAGADCETLDWAAGTRSEPLLNRAADPAAEAAACAAWARKQMESNPDTRVGILVPDLGSQRAEVERQLRHTLSPESFPITAAQPAELPFEFSLGIPLAQVPLIAAALLILRWLIEPLEQAEVTWLLLSGFISAPPVDAGAAGQNDSLLALAEWEASLRERKLLPLRVELAPMLRLFSPGPPLAVASLRQLQAALTRLRSARPSASYSDWSALTRTLLHDAGWSGTRGSDSASYQAARAWERALDELASLDLLGKRTEFAAFLAALHQHVDAALFSPESLDTPIQVLGAYESSGQAFDAIWFLGATDAQWPAPGSPHPLLPRLMQRELRMPHADPEADWELALAATERIARSAPHVLFSYPAADAAGALRCSTLLRGLAPPALTSRVLTGPARAAHTRVTELFADAAVVPWPGGEKAGGQDVLAAQAACPFRAFASTRLGARDLESSEHGLSPQERGTALHRVLQWVWSRDTDVTPHLRSRSDLRRAHAEGRLQPLLEQLTADALRRWTERASQPWEHAYLDAERERIVKLAAEWLAFESDRIDFEVEDCERELEVDVEGLQLSLRMDRIDRVPGGRLLVDYKTGKVSTAGWEGERPEEPQLPLYAVFGGIADVTGAVFAEVRAGATRFVGRMEDAPAQLRTDLSSNSDLMRKPYSESVRAQWEQVLRGLSASFLRGDAAVDPKEHPRTCRYCALGPLCRVAETQVALDGSAADPDQAEGGPIDE